MKLKLVVQTILFSSVFGFPAILFGGTSIVLDTCTTNDDCHNAITIPNVISDHAFVCTVGCNMFASPDTAIQACQMGDFPTVWYRLNLDTNAVSMNIEVYSTDFESPVISLFKGTSGCDNLEQVYLTSGNTACIIGADGVAKAIGTPVDSNTTYYLAISSYLSIGGSFELCVSAQSTGFVCVLDRNIEIVARSTGGPLEGPFEPNEKVSICMNVNEFTAAGNGCQWFQGIVPVFGNGWDLSSFDAYDQPINTFINGDTIGETNNGLYGASTWGWFNDVDYHHDRPSLNVSDLDGNGRVDMCNSVYEKDCPYKGLTGGCCGPCWGAPVGDILPPGWFAYGINGTCGDTAPPIRVDWGDGNTCSDIMGPWHFCFDLTTRDIPDCLGDSTKKDLSLGFYTFADGETGSWTGAASVCANDLPVKLSLLAKCGRVSTNSPEILPNLCSGDTLRFQMDEPNIDYWEWNISPFRAVPYIENRGENGFTIEAPVINESGESIDITGILIGHELEREGIVLKKFKFKINDPETCGFVSENSPHDNSGKASNHIRIYPMPVNESALLEWTFDFHNEATVTIYNSQGEWIENISVVSGDDHILSLDTKQLSSGIYFVSLSNADFRYVTKMVKL